MKLLFTLRFNTFFREIALLVNADLLINDLPMKTDHNQET